MEGEKIAGWGFLYLKEWLSQPQIPSGKVTRIVNVYTKPQYRRKGHARELMVHMLDIAKAWGTERVTLDASPMGKHLYSDLGFKELPRTTDVPMQLDFNS